MLKTIFLITALVCSIRCQNTNVIIATDQKPMTLEFFQNKITVTVEGNVTVYNGTQLQVNKMDWRRGFYLKVPWTNQTNAPELNISAWNQTQYYIEDRTMKFNGTVNFTFVNYDNEVVKEYYWDWVYKSSKGYKHNKVRGIEYMIMTHNDPQKKYTVEILQEDWYMSGGTILFTLGLVFLIPSIILYSCYQAQWIQLKPCEKTAQWIMCREKKDEVALRIATQVLKNQTEEQELPSIHHPQLQSVIQGQQLNYALDTKEIIEHRPSILGEEDDVEEDDVEEEVMNSFFQLLAKCIGEKWSRILDQLLLVIIHCVDILSDYAYLLTVPAFSYEFKILLYVFVLPPMLFSIIFGCSKNEAKKCSQKVGFGFLKYTGSESLYYLSTDKEDKITTRGEMKAQTAVIFIIEDCFEVILQNINNIMIGQTWSFVQTISFITGMYQLSGNMIFKQKKQNVCKQFYMLGVAIAIGCCFGVLVIHCYYFTWVEYRPDWAQVPMDQFRNTKHQKNKQGEYKQLNGTRT